MSKNIYLFLGPEEGKKADELHRIKEALMKAHGELEVSRFYAYESSASDLVALMRNGSLFSAHKLLILNNAESLKAEDVKILCSYVQNPSEQATLILQSSENKLNAKLAQRVGKSNTKIFWEMFDSEKRSWLFLFFKQNGKQVSNEAVSLLLDLVENNTTELKNVCQQLLLFFHEKALIDEEDVEKFVYHSKQESVFTLFEKISAAAFSDVLEVYHSLLLGGEAHPAALFGGLSWQFRKLFHISTYMDQQFSLQDACKHAGINGKRRIQQYGLARKHYSTQQIKRILSLIKQYEVESRLTTTQIHSLLFEFFLYQCVVEKGSRAMMIAYEA